MTHYRQGKEFERRVKTRLEKDGYFVIQAGGSRGAADLVALKVNQTLLVQVKRTNPIIPKAERAELVRVADLVGGSPIVAFQPAPRKPVAFRLLTGPGPKEWQPWTPDEVAAA